MANTICLSVFYLPILPIGIIFSFFGMSLMYFIEKYNVLRSYKKPAMIDGRITDFYIDMFKVIIFIYAASNFVFFSGVYAGFVRYEFFGILIFGILLLFPYSLVLENVMFVQAADTDHDGYEDQYFEIGMNYEMANPITKDKGFEKYLEKMMTTNIITQEEYSENAVKIKTAPSDILELFFQKKYGKTPEKKKIIGKFAKKSQTKEAKSGGGILSGIHGLSTSKTN